ncbi:MAG: peptidylprolyl isomerase [Sideroxyarcus sp.]|nr:peptidylprolyl isomerase [Sideroxyarcus sp.]
MHKFSRFALLSALLAVAAVVQAADDKSAALVNGVSIPQSRLDMRIKAATQQGQPDSPEMRKAIRDDLVNLEVISQAAVKNGLDKQPEIAQQLELARQSVLAGAFVQDYAKSHPITDEVLKKEYEELKTRVGNKEYKLSHILVESEEAAKKVAAELKKKGSKFAKVAKTHTKDPGSKDNGGDLGWAVPSNFVQPFGEAVLTLNKGQVSAPVQTQYGWHIIKLEDTRELKVPPFEELKPNIEKRQQQQAIQKAIEELRTKAKIE